MRVNNEPTPSSTGTPSFWVTVKSAAENLRSRTSSLVQVKPDDDLFPVLAAYGEGPQATIDLNRLTAENPLRFTLADCIAATSLSGRAPEVVSARAFEPGEQQTGLVSIRIPGGGIVGPKREDFNRAFIDHRQELKQQLKSASQQDRESLDVAQNTLKIMANVIYNMHPLCRPMNNVFLDEMDTGSNDPSQSALVSKQGRFSTDGVESSIWLRPTARSTVSGGERVSGQTLIPTKVAIRNPDKPRLNARGEPQWGRCFVQISDRPLTALARRIPSPYLGRFAIVDDPAPVQMYGPVAHFNQYFFRMRRHYEDI